LRTATHRVCLAAAGKTSRRFGTTLNPGWGVVQLVGHLTVNEDGVGSSPTAPAKLANREPIGRVQSRDVAEPALILHDGEAGFGPTAPAAVHRNDFVVAHLLKIVRRKG
jgi:hypothetical protein